MQAVFSKTKVKSWIKKAHKRASFGYGHGYVTDGHILLVDEPHMHPTILEVYGTLTPKCEYSAEQFQRLINLPDESTEVINSQLEFTPDPKSRLRIFYDPKTGRNLAVDSIYFDLLDNPKVHRFYSNNSMSMLWIMYDNEIVGVIAPVRLQDKLSHIKFKMEEEEVKE